ncbi:hypothetical protein [Dyella choica]|uniref:Uncharacterized protein n=1 Tax=Dyella choica TaxID=1927959 RepID=A0A3S0RM72_9GAMM|nr:hypothetical protein [Dyella choica]RUL78253.1 hypothetical protein EKH80_05310 [Dyella choica]
MEYTETAAFRTDSHAWILDDYSCEIRYLAHKDAGKNVLFFASVRFGWRLSSDLEAFHKGALNLVAGVIRMDKLPRAKLREIFDSALSGNIQIQESTFSLNEDLLECRRPFQPVDAVPERKVEFLQCKMVSTLGGSQVMESWHQIFTPALDAELGRHEPLFDGFDHLLHSLDLPDPRLRNVSPHVEVVVEPPANFDMERSGWDGDRLKIAILAHGATSWNAVTLMGRDGPKTMRGPLKPFGGIEWIASGEGKQSAWSCTSFPGARDVTAILKIGGLVASRQPFPHPTRASNARYVAIEKNDPELKKLQLLLLTPGQEARRFEQAVAALLFLRGFNPGLSMNTDSADIVMTTPGGRWMLVECSVTLDDARKKFSKLVRRRAKVFDALKDSSHSSEVVACLVCILPGNQVANPSDYLRKHEVQLWTKEDVEREWSLVRHPGYPDKQFLEIAKAVSDAASLNLPPSGGEDPFDISI